MRTEIPGPRSQEILERKERVIAEPLSLVHPIVVAEGRGATLTDVDGNTFIDFTGGVGCLNVGHSHPRLVEAAQEQLARFAHTDFTIVPYEVYVELAERLIELAPISGPAKAAFFNAGTEAVENSIKFARSYTKRPAVIVFEGAFHGRTMLSMTMTSKTHPYKAGLGPFAPEVYRVPYPHSYRGPDATAALAALRARVPHAGRAESVAAIVIEPVLGEGGFVVAPHGVRRRACARSATSTASCSSSTRCRPASAAPGRMWAIEHYDVEPDLMTMAKSIAGGLPLSGVIGKAEIMDAPDDSAIGGTYVGNPVAQAAALAVLDVFDEENLVERAACDRRHDSLAHGGLAGALGRRSATCAASVRCSRSSSSSTRETKEPDADRRDGRRRGGRPERAAPAQVRRLRELHPRADAARPHGRGARRGPRRLGAGARHASSPPNRAVSQTSGRDR